jgi:hypothetical protein
MSQSPIFNDAKGQTTPLGLRASDLNNQLRAAGNDPEKIAEVTFGAIALSVGLARTLKDFLQK